MKVDYLTTKDKKNFKDIILKHLEKILEITTNEFRGGFFEEKIVNNMIEKIYVPDTRKQYIQSVESLSHILLPHFDKEMELNYKEIIEKVKTLDKNWYSSTEKVGSKTHYKYINDKLNLMKELFIEINLLLKRLDYLRYEAYSEISGIEEGDDEEAEDTN